ncbi:MAG: ABC transporter substrate-binding protein [Deltaproteobacteria bacterium]
MKKALLLCLLILLVTPSLAHPEEPIDVLKRTINLGITLLQDPQYQVASRKEEQQERLCDTAGRVFDFREFSKRVLASNWRHFSPEQRNEFVKVFAEFLCKYYITRLQKRYTNERVIFLGQDFLGNRVARVKVNVLWKGLEVPVEARMLKRNSTWKVYDLIVLGVSGVKNYRAQFQALFRSDTPSQVINRIRNRIEEEGRKG